MAKGTRICKICGKEYEYCKTWLNQNKFRWQDVACSPECGTKYFALIEASRTGKPVDIEPKEEKEVEVEQNVEVEDEPKMTPKTTQRRKQRSKKDEDVDQ